MRRNRIKVRVSASGSTESKREVRKALVETGANREPCSTDNGCLMHEDVTLEGTRAAALSVAFDDMKSSILETEF